MPTHGPTIIEKPPMRLIGMTARYLARNAPEPNVHDIVPPLWGRFIGRQAEAGHDGVAPCFGASWEVPGGAVGERDYIAGFGSDRDPVPEGFVAVDVPGGLYAVFVHEGLIMDFGDTVAEVYDRWLPGSDYTLGGAIDVELYDERFNGDTPDSVCEYWVPIRSKSS